MNNESNHTIEQYRSFAESALNNHLMEFNTEYGGEQIKTREMREEAFSNHRSIFEKELNDEIRKLAAHENPWLDSEIDQLKKHYLDRLHPGKRRFGL